MVYCGKPSEGCELCRSRRIKVGRPSFTLLVLSRDQCDRLHPVCTQCKRIDTPCPGYRNVTDLVFRDLTEDVKSKCTRKKARRGKEPAVPLVPEEPEACEAIGPTWMPKQVHSFSEDCAALIFFHDHVVRDKKEWSNIFDALPQMYMRSSPESPLSHIIAALGLVSMANNEEVPQVMYSAQVKYAMAVHALNVNIRSPASATTDETLLMVMLLGLYEDTATTADSLNSWTQHVNGALALLDVRGTEHLKTPEGRQLFTGLRTSVIANCLLRHCSVPPCIIKWSSLLQEHQSSDEASSTALAHIAMSFCGLQERIKTAQEADHRIDVISDALVTDVELEKWAAVEQYERPYTSIEAEPMSPLVFRGEYHTYRSIAVATRYNRYRSLRIMIHEIVLNQLQPYREVTQTDSYFETTAPDQRQAELSNLVITTLSQDVCASVRYCLGYGTEIDESHRPEKAALAKLVLWPLYTAERPSCIPDTTSSWIANTFDFITKVTGIRKAASLAKASKAWPCNLDKRTSPEEGGENMLMRGE